MDEFPPGAGPSQEEDFSKMPIEERLSAKAWKARVSAYEELVRIFSRTASDSDPAFRLYTRNPDLVKAMVTDSNAVAQEKGVDAARAFVEFGGKSAGKTREAVVPAVVEKCLGSTRAGTKKAALELLCFYVENEDVMGSEGPVTDVCNGLGAKQPKVVAGCVTALKELVRQFGPKQVNPKPILKRLPDIFGHSDKTVRAEGALLAQELHRYIGAALNPTLDTLKDIQAKDLRQQFEELDKKAEGKPTPSRHLLSEKAAAEIAAEQAAGGEGDDGAETGQGEDADEPLDAYEFAEPLDFLKSNDFPSNFDEMIVSKKWQERKEVEDALLTLLKSSPKLKAEGSGTSYDSLVDALAERIKKDANINVVLVACQCLEAMAKGLRSGFGRHKEKVLPALLEKLKEKKVTTVHVLAEALDAIFQTVTFSDVLEDILGATKHKNPAVKTEAIKYLVRCLRNTRTPPAKSDIKPIADMLVDAMGDGSADVRNAGAQGLGTLMKLVGERMMNQYLEQLDDIKKAKVQEEYKTAEVKAKMGPAAAPKKPAPMAAAPALKARAPPKAAPPANKENDPPSRSETPTKPVAKPPARLMAKKPAPTAAPAAAKKPALPAAAPAGKPASKGAASASEPVRYRFNAEDAEARASELIPAGIAAQIASGNWKERLQGMTDFLTWLGGEVESVESEVIVRALGKKPGWKESNFQVLTEVYKVLQLLAEQSPTFGRSTVALSVQPLCDKLGDIKLRTAAGETLCLYAEKTAFGFVLNQALGPLSNLKAPKAIADSLLWVNQSILEFGTSGVDVRSVIDFLLTCLKSANAGVRTNATQVISTLARFLGSALTTFLGDLNPQLRTTIEGEIEKATGNPPPAPTRFSAESKPAAGAKGGASTAAADSALDDLIPRVDLDKIIPSATVARLNNSNWKERKEGLEEIQGILQANQRLKGNMNELVVPLKGRFSDSNKAVQTLALDVLGRIATGMNKPFETHARTFIPPVTTVLADAKAPIRASASAALTAMAEQIGISPMIGGFSTVLESKVANPTLRQDLFTWLAAWFEQNPPAAPLDLAPLALPVVQCLDDKAAPVRKAAQAVLPFIITRAGYKHVMEQTNSLKAASRNSVIPMIDTAKALAAPPAPAKAAPAKVGAAKPAPVKTAAAAAHARSDSPGPGSPKPSGLARAPSVKPPSAVGRSLKAPSSMSRPTSRLDTEDPAEPSSGLAGPGFKSRLAGIKAPAPSASAAAGPSSSALADKSAPFLSADPKFKQMREKKEGRGQHWIGNEGAPRPELSDALRQQCENHCSHGLIDSMFSKDHNAERDYLSALTLLSDFISSPTFAEEEYGLSQEETVGRVVANTDLVLKYVAIRLTDNNTSISLKCLDILDNLADLLRAEMYHMTDYEANSLFPCLIAKFGDPKVAFRDRIREIFRKLGFVFPPSKLLSHYVENGLPSKNARVRTECLGELGFLFSKNGLQVCTPSKTLPVVAKHIGDRDAAVRTAALLTLGEAYKIVGDDIYKLVGTLSGKDRSLLEERLKRTAAPAPKSLSQRVNPTSPPHRARTSAIATSPPAGEGTPRGTKMAIPSRLARPQSTVGSGIPAAGGRSRLPALGGRRESAIPPAVRRSLGMPEDRNGSSSPSPPESPSRQHASLRSSSNGGGPPSSLSQHQGEGYEQYSDGAEDAEEEDFAVEQAINEILSSDSDRSVDALKRVEREIHEVAPSLVHHADQLAIVLGKQIHRAFTFEGTNMGNERLKKHLMVTGTSVFDVNRVWEDGCTLGSYMSRPALIPLLTELLQRLIDASAQTDDPSAQTYSKYLNIIVLRSFSACNLNNLFAACLSMLHEATEDMRDLSGDVLKTRSKFAELIIKCLWKIAKRLPTSLQDDLVEPQQLLVDLEHFLQAIPPAEWKRRAADGVPLADLPLRTIKVILTHYANVFGEDALAKLELVSEPENSFVYSYLIRLLNMDDRTERGPARDATAPMAADDDLPDAAEVAGGDHAVGGALGPTSPPLDSEVTDRINGSSSRESQDLDEAANAELRAIFDRISHKDQSRQAIRELYEYQKKYPHKEASIQRSLQNTGPIFQRYIKRALANHAAEDDSVDAPSKRESTSTTLSARDSIQSSSRTSMPPQDNASVGSRSSVFASNPASPPPATSSHVRSSTTDDRLAELHAKFGLSRSSTQLSASGASGTATPGLGMESNSGAESGASSVPNPTAGPGTSASDALRQKLAAMKNVGAASNGSSSTLTSAPAPEENVEA